MLSLRYPTFEMFGRQVAKRQKTLDMRPWLNAKYPQFRSRSRSGIGSRIRTLTRTFTQRRNNAPVGRPAGEGGFIYKRRFRPLSRRRARRFRRRMTSSYDKAILRGQANISHPSRLAPSGDVVWFQTNGVADPDAFIKGLPGVDANNFTRIYYHKIGFNVEVYNPGSYGVNYQLIWGTVDELTTVSSLQTFGNANAPQLNPYRGAHGYGTIWDSIRGQYIGKIAPGCRQRFKVWCNLGSRRIEQSEPNKKSKYTAFHLVYYPDFVVKPAASGVWTGVGYPYAEEESCVVFTQPFYHIFYPPNLYLSSIQPPNNTINGLSTVATSWLTKQEDETVDQS